MIQHGTYPSLQASRKRDRLSRMDSKQSTASYIAAKWHRPASTERSTRFSCGRHIVAALLILIFGAATTAATHKPADDRGAESASAASHQNVSPGRSL